MHAFRAALVVALLLALGATSGSAAAEEMRVLASTYRVDLGSVAPGQVRAGEIVLSNPGYEPMVVRLVHEGDPALVETPSEVEVAPGIAHTLRYQAHVPEDAPPGFHGEALKLLPRAAAHVAPGSGTLDAGTAIVFTWRVSAVGVSAIEVPAVALPGEDLRGALVLVSTWHEPANVTVRLEWRDASAALLRAATLGPTPLAPNASARIAYELPAAEGLAGAQSLTARLTDAGAAPTGGAAVQTFHLGRREAIFSLGSVRDLLDGNASVTIAVENTGDVPTTIVPRVLVRDATGALREILLDAITLAPGERRDVTRTIELPPGRFSFAVEADGAERALSPAAAGDAPLELTMREPPAPGRALEVAIAISLLALGLALAFVAWRKRAGILAALGRIPKPKLRAPRATPGASAASAPVAEHDAFDALFVKLEVEHAAALPPPRVGAALLVDLETLGGGGGLPRLLDLAGDRRVDVAYAYARASSPEAGLDLQRALHALGFAPRVLVDAPDFHIEMTLDASREARAGRVIVVASADAAYARLARALEAEGVRVEILAPQPARRVPVEDRPTGFAPKQADRAVDR